MDLSTASSSSSICSSSFRRLSISNSNTRPTFKHGSVYSKDSENDTDLSSQGSSISSIFSSSGVDDSKSAATSPAPSTSSATEAWASKVTLSARQSYIDEIVESLPVRRSSNVEEKPIIINHGAPVALELRQHPRRTSSDDANARPPPPLVRQEERRDKVVGSLVDTATCMIEVIWPLSVMNGTSCKDVTKSVLGLRLFIEEVLRRSKASYSIFSIAMYYLILIKPVILRLDFANFQQNNHTTGSMSSQSQQNQWRTTCCGRRMFLAALMLASKYLQDRSFSARAWSKISGLSVQEINANEAAFLKAVQWNLHVPASLYQKWTDLILKISMYTTPNLSLASSSKPDLGVGAVPEPWRALILRLSPELEIEDLDFTTRNVPMNIGAMCAKRELDRSASAGPRDRSLSPVAKAGIASNDKSTKMNTGFNSPPSPHLRVLPTPDLTPRPANMNMCMGMNSTNGGLAAKTPSICRTQSFTNLPLSMKCAMRSVEEQRRRATIDSYPRSSEENGQQRPSTRRTASGLSVCTLTSPAQDNSECAAARNHVGTSVTSIPAQAPAQTQVPTFMTMQAAQAMIPEKTVQANAYAQTRISSQTCKSLMPQEIQTVLPKDQTKAEQALHRAHIIRAYAAQQQAQMQMQQKQAALAAQRANAQISCGQNINPLMNMTVDTAIRCRAPARSAKDDATRACRAPWMNPQPSFEGNSLSCLAKTFATSTEALTQAPVHQNVQTPTSTPAPVPRPVTAMYRPASFGTFTQSSAINTTTSTPTPSKRPTFKSTLSSSSLRYSESASSDGEQTQWTSSPSTMSKDDFSYTQSQSSGSGSLSFGSASEDNLSPPTPTSTDSDWINVEGTEGVLKRGFNLSSESLNSTASFASLAGRKRSRMIVDSECERNAKRLH